MKRCQIQDLHLHPRHEFDVLLLVVVRSHRVQDREERRPGKEQPSGL